MDKYQTLREKDNPENNVYPNIKGANIPSSAITASKIASGAVTSTKIADFNVTETKIAQNAVSTGKIVNGAVTNDKLGNNSVSTDKIQDESITGNKLNLAQDDIRSQTIEISRDNGNIFTMYDDGISNDLASITAWVHDICANPRFLRFFIDENGVFERVEVIYCETGVELQFQRGDDISIVVINTELLAQDFYNNYSQKLQAVML